MAMKDWVLPGALIAAGATIIYQFTRRQHLEGKLSLAESGGERPLATSTPAQAAQATAQTSTTSTASTAGSSEGLGSRPLTRRNQARLLTLYRAGNITGPQYLAAGGDYMSLRRAEDEMAEGYMVPQHSVYGPPTI